MITSAELSLYPLTANYEPAIISFISVLRNQPGIRVATNGLSTQLTGEYEAVMNALTIAIRPSIADETACSFVIKILNVAIDPVTEVIV